MLCKQYYYAVCAHQIPVLFVHQPSSIFNSNVYTSRVASFGWLQDTWTLWNGSLPTRVSQTHDMTLSLMCVWWQHSRSYFCWCLWLVSLCVPVSLSCSCQREKPVDSLVGIILSLYSNMLIYISFIYYLLQNTWTYMPSTCRC